MAYQNTFQRYEFKYLLTEDQKNHILHRLTDYMTQDQYGQVVIRNLYYDTDNYRLIRHSLEKPIYKEKLRIRSYKCISDNEPVFVELKKKYNHVVYKRRLTLPQADALTWLSGNTVRYPTCQIGSEIEYFRDYYKTLRPVVYLSYNRQAWCCPDGNDFRVTFDHDILCRQEELSLSSEPYGTSLLPPGMTLMEIKTSGGIPLWMTELLTKKHIYKTSFSKYGTAYKTIIFPDIYHKGVIYHA